MHATKAEIDALKASVDILDVIGRAIELKKQGRYYAGLCPFHQEKTGSLIVDPKRALWNCLGGCRANGNGQKSGGDVITFVMKWKGLSFQEALEYLGFRPHPPGTPSSGNGGNGGNGNGGNGGGHTTPAAAPLATAQRPSPSPSPGCFSVVQSRAPRTELLSRSIAVWQKELSENLRAQEWLESRGLVTRDYWRSFRLGYSTGSLADLCGTEASEARSVLTELGLLNADGKETMRGRVLFPLFALNQLPVNVYGRSLCPCHDGRIRDGHVCHHLFPKGKLTGFFNQGAGKRGREVLAVESVICALSLCEAKVFTAMPLYGVHEPSEALKELLQRHGVTSVVVALDSDDTGRRAAPGMVESFREMGFSSRSIEWPEKDPNDILVKEGPDSLRQIADRLLAPPKARDLRLGDVPSVPSASRGSESLASSASEPSPSISSAPTEDRASIKAPPLIAVAASRPRLWPLEGPDAAEAPAPEVAPRPEEEPAPMPAPTQPEQALAPSTVAPSIKEEKPLPAPSLQASPDDLRRDALLVRYEDRRWDVRWLESPSDAHVRARARLDLLPEAADEGAPSLLTFFDSLNLVAARSRETFVRRAVALIAPEAQRLLPPADALSRLLHSDLMRLGELGEERRQLLLQKAEAPSALPPERQAAGLAYLMAPGLLRRLAEDLDAMGYVGERKAKVLGYLVSISRKLPQALSMVILSSSGSGKSALADVLEKLTPEEDLLVVTRFTAASLYWMGKDALKRKFVSIEERAGSQEADYAIRALQSKGQVTQMVPIKDQATGKIETRFLVTEGPTSSIESTTESEIHFENSTRCFELRLDESPEQTRRIHEAQRFAKTPEGRRARRRADALSALHRDVQRCLRVLTVAIPWADLLTFPSAWTRNRRDHPRFLNLIEVIAFLHQHQRPLCHADTDEPCTKGLTELSDEELSQVYVEATEEDYGAAKALYGEVLAETLAELKKPIRAFHDALREMVEEKRKRGDVEPALSVREVRQRTRLEQRVIRRYFAELVELEYAAVTRGPNGTPNTYRLVELPERKEDIEGLLSVEELRARIEERKKKRESRGGKP